MKRTLISIAILPILLFVSCVPTANEVQTMTQSTRLLQQNFEELKDAVNESQVIDQEKADKFFKEADNVLVDMNKVADAIEGREGVDAIKEGVKATSEWNPYAAPILLAINVLQGLGLFGLGKANKTKGDALTEIVVGVEGGGEKSDPLRNSLIANTSVKTKALVNTIKKQVA